MIIECWQRGRLVAVHKGSSDLTVREILQRFGLNDTWTVCTYPDGRPDQVRTVQRENPTQGRTS